VTLLGGTDGGELDLGLRVGIKGGERIFIESDSYAIALSAIHMD